jgi:hypothetical protein
MHSRLELIEATDPVGPELVTLEVVKTELGITGTSEDAALQARITRASNIVAEFCNRIFAFSAAVETFTFDTGEQSRPGQALTLSLFPNVTVDSVAVNGTTLDAAGYEVDANSGELWLVGGGVWSGSIVVTYSGGYDLPDGAPSALAQAVIEMVRAARFASQSSDIDASVIQSISHGDTSVTLRAPSSSSSSFSSNTASLPLGVIDLLAPFRQPAFA